jgi:hypothetical protein
MVARAGRIIASDLPDDARGNFVFHELVKTEVAALTVVLNWNSERV